MSKSNPLDTITVATNLRGRHLVTVLRVDCGRDGRYFDVTPSSLRRVQRLQRAQANASEPDWKADAERLAMRLRTIAEVCHEPHDTDDYKPETQFTECSTLLCRKTATVLAAHDALKEPK